MVRALLYLRQSDSDGAGAESLSIESQLSVLRDDAQRHQWTVVGVIRDADQKGWDDRRPGLGELYERVRAGGVDVIAFWALSRLARSVRIQETVVHELDQLGVALWSHKEPFVSHPMFRQIVGAFNEQQTRDIQAHVQRAIRERAQRGLFNGSPPYGYVTVPGQPLAVDEDGAAVVRRIFALRAAGATVREIALTLTAEGTPTARGARGWSYPMVRNVLRNVAYRGTVRHLHIEVADAHPAIVDDALWRSAHLAPARPRAPRAKGHGSWLEGLTEHACGRPMYLIASRNGKGVPYRCFRCRYESRYAEGAAMPRCAFSPRSIAVSRLESLVWLSIQRDLARILAPKQAYDYWLEEYRALRPAAEARHAEAQQRKARAIAQRQRADLLFTTNRRDLAWFDAQDALVSAEIAEAERILADTPGPPREEDVVVVWDALKDLRAHLAQDMDIDRAAVLRELGIVVVGAGGVSIRYDPEWRRLLPD